MPESPDFDQIARRVAGVWGDSSTLKPLTEAIAAQLRLVWNARGAADLATIETLTEASSKILDRAIRRLDR